MTTQLPAGTPPRTDDEIGTAVVEELSWAPGTGAATIGVDVTGGAVTLSGQVDSYPERLRAGLAVHVPDTVKVAVHDRVVTLSGIVAWQHQRQAATYAVQYSPCVGSVTNLIEVRPGAEPVEVGPAIRAALVRRSDVESSNVTVTVEGGVVTLSGTVLTWAERRHVENLCWAAPAVAVVENDLKIGS